MEKILIIQSKLSLKTNDKGSKRIVDSKQTLYVQKYRIVLNIKNIYQPLADKNNKIKNSIIFTG